MLTAFVLDSLFKDICIAKSLERETVCPRAEVDLFVVQDNKDNLSLWGKVWAGFPAAPFKRLAFPRFRIPQLWHTWAVPNRINETWGQAELKQT